MKWKMTARQRADLNSLDVDVVLSILGNPNKRNIILFLGERGKASFTEMRKGLGMSVGNLYYNLDGLAGFVTKDENRRYMLTEEGLRLYQILKEETQRIDMAFRPKSKLYGLLSRYLAPLLYPTWLFKPLYRNPKVAALGAAASLGLMVALLSLTRFDITLLSLSRLSEIRDYVEALPGLRVPIPAWVAVKSLASWALLVALIELEARVFGVGNVSPDFVLSVPLALLPLLVYPVLYRATAHLMTGLVGSLELAAVFRVLQLLSLGLLTALISVFKKMTADRALLIAFSLYYASYLLEIFI